MGLGDWLSGKKMREPVQGSFQVISCSSPSGADAWQTVRMQGVVTGPGLGTTTVDHECMAPTGGWPQPGLTLPVTVDRAKPKRLVVNWGTAEQPVVGPAGGVPEGVRVNTSTWSTTASLPNGVPANMLGGEVQSLIDKLVSDAKAAGATVTTNVEYNVIGAPGRPVPGVPGGGMTPEQSAAAQAGRGGLVAAQGTVIAAHDVPVPAGMPGGGAAGTVDLTLDVQVPGGEGFATTTRISFSTAEKRERIATVGTVLPVLVDPNAHDRIVIDTTCLS